MKRLVSSVLIASMVLAGGVAFADEAEYNDEYSYADGLSYNVKEFGTIGSTGDIDWWTFVADYGQSLYLDNLEIFNNADMAVYVKNSSGNLTLLSNHATSGDDSVNLNGGQTYFIRVVGTAGADYTLHRIR